MYARYRTRSRFYKRPEKVLRAYNVTPNLLRRPIVKKGLLSGVYADETVDLRDRERLDLLESIRHPRERDFYQDHTYHNQWITRDLEQQHKNQLTTRYRFFSPNYEIKPWIWYPGDIVEVVSGEGVGQRGAILAVIKYKNEIVVQNVNVRDIVLPASENRPEQVLQREHPIRVTRVRHIDPKTNERCDLELVKVRNRKTGEMEEARISLESGTLLPIPAREEDLTVGDPLKDTAMQDADEPTYDAEQEMAILVERRLHAMEDYFVKTLKESYKFHHPLQVQNGEQLQAFQLAVLDRAAEKLAERIAATHTTTTTAAITTTTVEDEATAGVATDEMPAWWREMVVPYVELLKEEEAHAAEVAQQQEEAATAAERAEQRLDGDDDDDDDDELLEEDQEEQEDEEEEGEEKESNDDGEG